MPQPTPGPAGPSSAPPGPFPDAVLDALRNTGDPPADEVLAALVRRHDIARVNHLLHGLVRNEGPLPPDLPPELREYFQATERLPAFADPHLIRRGQEVFTLYGPLFGLVLMAKSLPILYAGAQGGAQTLHATGQLTRNFRRRASETLRFILNVMEVGGLEPGGKGIRSIQKVRLMHASIRHFAAQSPFWKSELRWGVPINQEELAGTLLAFSSLALEGLKKLEVELSEADERAYLHAWTAVGHVLGIRAELFCPTPAEARTLWARIEERNFSPTPEGRELALDHLRFLEEMIPGKQFDGLARALMRFLMGGKVSRILALPRPDWTYFLIALLRHACNLEDKIVMTSGGLRRLTAEASTLLMESLYRYWNAGRGTPFDIPERLRDRDPSPGRVPGNRVPEKA